VVIAELNGAHMDLLKAFKGAVGFYEFRKQASSPDHRSRGLKGGRSVDNSSAIGSMGCIHRILRAVDAHQDTGNYAPTKWEKKDDKTDDGFMRHTG
jgi:hypothetical protein